VSEMRRSNERIRLIVTGSADEAMRLLIEANANAIYYNRFID